MITIPCNELALPSKSPRIVLLSDQILIPLIGSGTWIMRQRTAVLHATDAHLTGISSQAMMQYKLPQIGPIQTE